MYVLDLLEMKKMSNHIRLKLFLLIVLLHGIGCSWSWSQSTNVWPGDVNESGKVNHVDLLYLGLNLGEQGPSRDSISILWVGQSANKWAPLVTSRPDPVHADCNGDSTVDLADITAIEVNYGWDKGFVNRDSSSLVSSGGDAVPLSFDYSSGALAPGVTDTIFFELGNANQVVDSILGFAASITFDSTLVDSVYLWMGDSWLGTPGLDMETIEHYASGKFEFAATRTDQEDVREQQGRIGGIVVVMIDNLKREVQIDSLDLEFEEVLGMASGFTKLEVVVTPSNAPVFSSTAPLEALVYPVPARDGMTVSLLSVNRMPVQGKLYSGQGELLRNFTIEDTEYRINRLGLDNGVYLLELKTGDQYLRKRIIFIN